MAIILIDHPSTDNIARDIIVRSHMGFSYNVKYYFGCYEPLQYPLLFPHGDTGWHQGIVKINTKNKGATCRGQDLVAPNVNSSADELICQERQGTSIIIYQSIIF